MSLEAKLAIGILVFACAAMASNKLRYDIIAILVMLLLMFSGILTPAQALSGFGSPVVVMIAALLVVGEMLDRTGAARIVGDFILKHGGKKETVLLATIMACTCLLGCMMSSTAIVAIFIPIVLRVAEKTRLNPSKLLLPMSYAALISGMITLISTPPNLVVHGELVSAGYEGFGFFSFSKIGLSILAAAMGYILLIRKWLPQGAEVQSAENQLSSRGLLESIGKPEGLDYLRVNKGSSLVGRAIKDCDLATTHQVHIFGLRKADGSIKMATADEVIQENDNLAVHAPPENLKNVIRDKGLTPLEKPLKIRQQFNWEYGVAEILIHPESGLRDHTIKELGFQSRYGLRIFGVKRKQEVLENYLDEKLTVGDSLVIAGPWEQLRSLHQFNHDFVVTKVSSDQADVVPAYKRLPYALGILALMIVLSVFQIVPLVAAVMVAALLAVFTRCLDMDQGYRAIHWNSIVLTAGMLPLADALQQTGLADMVVDGLMGATGEANPRIMFTILFFLTASLGLFLSNTASAVLVAPIAIVAAQQLNISPYPLCIGVMIAASAAFMTPVSTPVVTLVVEPGNYRFTDFLRLGIPLLLIVYLVTLLLAPMIFPF